MQAGLSTRALLYFFMLEFALVGLLALTSQFPHFPWWLWFIASGLLYVAIWWLDHFKLVRVWWRTVPRAWLLSGSVGLALLLIAAPALYWVAQNRQATGPIPIGTLDHALLAVTNVKTKQLHDPVKLEVVVANLGRLPTIKSQIHVAFLVADSPTPVSVVDKKFADHFADKDRFPMIDQTTVPGIGHVLIIWTYEVTENVIEEMKAGKKNFFVFLVAEYTDAKTPTGQRIITEVAFRSSPTASGPMRDWSHVRERTYISD